MEPSLLPIHSFLPSPSWPPQRGSFLFHWTAGISQSVCGLASETVPSFQQLSATHLQHHRLYPHPLSQLRSLDSPVFAFSTKLRGDPGIPLGMDSGFLSYQHQSPSGSRVEKEGRGCSATASGLQPRSSQHSPALQVLKVSRFPLGRNGRQDAQLGRGHPASGC